MFRVANKDLWNLANRVLKFYRTRMNIISETYCVDVEALAGFLGYHVQNVSLGEDAEIMGFTAFDPAVLDLNDQCGYLVTIAVDANTIVLNESIKDSCFGRYRFTSAHEVAHLILDMVYHLNYKVRYRSNPKGYRDGTKIDEVETGKDQNWAYSFNNLYQYHDGGKEYTYTIGEEPVSGYTVKVDGYNLKNTLVTGAVNLTKADSDENPMKGVSFKLYTESGKPVASVSNGQIYKFWDLSDDEEKTTYVTGDDGMIHIEELPIGKYYFEETETLLGFIPYGEKIPFEIKEGSDETLEISIGAENAKIVMPETGGSGSMMFYIVSITLAGLAVMTLCIRKVKNPKTKRGKLS